INGVKGFSILSSLPLIDLGTCVVPEYMHSVLLGVVKHYVNLLLKKAALINYLDEKYFQHLMLLVIALFDLLQDKILIQPDLQRAEKLLDLFVEKTPSLYSDRDMTYNFHQLRHLGLCNGYIANCVHGNKNMGQEIVNNLKIAQGVQILKS
ncbi:GSCOCG00010795001-RA-CDS, partial [Cotesia congregata]